MKTDVVATLVDTNSNNILEFSYFNWGRGYNSDICIIDLDNDKFTGNLCINEQNYQAEMVSIADNILYENGIMLNRSNDYMIVSGLGNFTNKLSDYVKQDIDISSTDGDDDYKEIQEFFTTTLETSRHGVEMEYEIQFAYNNNDTYRLAITYILTKGYSKSAHDRIAEKFPELGFDGTNRVVAVINKKDISEFVLQLYMLLGRATVESYCK